jgi:alkanesulfonate monooxygenase SsuD/methylene tetrahydromethanopterin reductase-like flavin-dependent oxidoreductase (luciferase family)
MATRQVRLAVALREPLPWPELAGLARAAEEAGFEAVFVPEVGHRDPFAMLAGFAGASERLTLATGVASMEWRTPQAMALGAATVHDLSGSRHLLGLGAGFQDLRTFRSYAAEVRSALEGASIIDGPMPIWFAALGDRAVEAAATDADGVLLNWCTPGRVAAAAEVVHSVRDGDRPFEIGVYLRCCLTGVNGEAPLEALRQVTSVYAAMPHYRRQFEAWGFGGELDPVSDRVVDAICVRGGTEAFRARAEELAEAGADVIVVYPVPAHEAVSSMLATILAAAPAGR